MAKNPFAPFQPRPEGGSSIHAISSIITIVCNCGSGQPLQIVFVPGLDLKTTCPHCRTSFKVTKLYYDEVEAPGKLNIQVGAIPAAIIPGNVGAEPPRTM